MIRGPFAQLWRIVSIPDGDLVTELQVQLRIWRDSQGVHSQLQLADESATEDFGPWGGLPETAHALLQWALLLEAKLEILRLLGEKRPILEEEIQATVRQMHAKSAESLIPKVVQHCLIELGRTNYK